MVRHALSLADGWGERQSLSHTVHVKLRQSQSPPKLLDPPQVFQRIFQSLYLFLCFTILDPGVESECESEINRQMLKRNKELEDCIKFQRETIQDQAMRIEVIS